MTDYEKLYAEQRDVCGEPFPEFVRAFASLPPGCKILDLGCGQGRDALVAARRGHQVVGVDLSPSGVQQMVQQAEAEGLAVVGVVADISIFQPDDGFDVVVLDRVLHMLPDHDARRVVLNRMAAVVRPGGHLLVADTPSNLPTIRSCVADQHQDWTPTFAKKGFLFWKRADEEEVAR